MKQASHWLSVRRQVAARIILGGLRGLTWMAVMALVAVAIATLAVQAADAEPSARNRVSVVLLEASVGGVIGTAATVLLLSSLQAIAGYRKRRAWVIASLRSHDRNTVSTMVEQLRATGELTSGFLDGVDLRGSNLEGMDLRHLRLRRGKLSGANLARAILIRADLRYTQLDDAELEGVIATDCRTYRVSAKRTTLPRGVRE